MSNLVTFSKAGLPAVSTLASSLRALQSDVGPAGVVIVKMDKTGHWVFGADQTEVEDDSTWAVNPFSFVHGFIAWGDGEVLGEKMTSVSNPLPELDEAPPQAKKGWETQVGMSIKCVSGEDKVWKHALRPPRWAASAAFRPWPWHWPSRSRKTKPSLWPSCV
jgi:hypothetical protein